MSQNSILLRIKKRIFHLSNPVVMGIVNVTPDSFYENSRVLSERDILKRAEEILSQGGEIIDIGGYSTRPTAIDITPEEEFSRLSFAISAIKKEFPEAILSADTFRADVADKVITDFEVDIINDVSGGTLDDNMFAVIAKHNVPYILMHMRGTPQTMQTMTSYDNITEEILLFFTERINRLTQMGVSDIILDPGFGFAKTTEQNYELLRNLSDFSILNRPILAGLSRKSMLYKALNTTPEHALPATIAANTLALKGGASILRVHDVKEAVDAITVYRHTNAAGAVG